MIDFLLPSSDAGVLIQAVGTLTTAPVVLVLAARRHRDLAWFAGGIVVLWVALLGFRALH